MLADSASRLPKRTRCLCISIILLSVIASIGSAEKTVRAARRRAATGQRKSFTHAERSRSYRIHFPRSYDGKTTVPLLFVFHGGGGTAEVASKMGFTPIADAEGFIVVYPEGLNKHWNDGRHSTKFAEQDARVDDVAFILALLKKLQKEFRIDRKRIYATGASNGGFFSHRLAIDASDSFAAVAVMIATLGKPVAEKFHPARPMPILFMNGTADPFVPYNGGPITPNFLPRLVDSKTHDFGRGRCISTGAAVRLWLARDGLANTAPKVTLLPNKAPLDGCRVERRVWSGGKSGTEVVLYRVTGGGHTIPGGVQYLPRRIIGRTCRDFDGLQEIWRFFKRHTR